MRRAVLLCSILSLTPLICAAQNGPLPPFDANFPRPRGAAPGLQWEYVEPPMSMQIPDRVRRKQDDPGTILRYFRTQAKLL